MRDFNPKLGSRNKSSEYLDTNAIYSDRPGEGFQKLCYPFNQDVDTYCKYIQIRPGIFITIMRSRKSGRLLSRVCYGGGFKYICFSVPIVTLNKMLQGIIGLKQMLDESTDYEMYSDNNQTAYKLENIEEFKQWLLDPNNKLKNNFIH